MLAATAGAQFECSRPGDVYAIVTGQLDGREAVVEPAAAWHCGVQRSSLISG